MGVHNSWLWGNITKEKRQSCVSLRHSFNLFMDLNLLIWLLLMWILQINVVKIKQKQGSSWLLLMSDDYIIWPRSMNTAHSLSVCGLTTAVWLKCPSFCSTCRYISWSNVPSISNSSYGWRWVLYSIHRYNDMYYSCIFKDLPEISV